MASPGLASGKDCQDTWTTLADNVQMVFPGLIVLFVWFIPESPRWLFVHNKREQSKNILTKWHGYGNPDSPWVSLQIGEYEEFLNTNGAVRSNSHTPVTFDFADNIHRTSAGGTTVPSSAIALPATVSCATVSSRSSVNGLATGYVLAPSLMRYRT